MIKILTIIPESTKHSVWTHYESNRQFIAQWLSMFQFFPFCDSYRRKHVIVNNSCIRIQALMLPNVRALGKSNKTEIIRTRKRYRPLKVFLQSKSQMTPDSPFLLLGPCESNHCRSRWIQMPNELLRGAVLKDATGQRSLLKRCDSRKCCRPPAIQLLVTACWLH